MKTNQVKTKGCPFCGCLETEVIEQPNNLPECNYYGVTVICVNCGAQGSTGKDEAEATKKWNTRK